MTPSVKSVPGIRSTAAVPCTPCTSRSSTTGTSRLGFQARSCVPGSWATLVVAHSATETNRPLRTSENGASSRRRSSTT